MSGQAQENYVVGDYIKCTKLYHQSLNFESLENLLFFLYIPHSKLDFGNFVIHKNQNYLVKLDPNEQSLQ